MVLFDGVCNFCNGAVNFIIDRDPRGKIAFASLQSAAAQELMRKHGVAVPEGDLDTFLLIDNGRIYDRSTAALRVAGKLQSPLAVFWIFLVVPRFVRDFFYRAFAKRRYKWFGKTDECRVPTPEIRERFVV